MSTNRQLDWERFQRKAKARQVRRAPDLPVFRFTALAGITPTDALQIAHRTYALIDDDNRAASLSRLKERKETAE